MEEKERYELFSELCIKDNNINAECQLLNTYQSCVILNQQDKRIKELEEENKKANINNYLEDYFLAEKENQQLKQQLEEKDKKIKKLTEELDDKNFCKDFVDLYTENKLKTQMLHENWKDKISFTIEQLEKVKNIILNERKITSFKFDIFNKGKDTALFWLNEQIDNQINGLKGEK